MIDNGRSLRFIVLFRVLRSTPDSLLLNVVTLLSLISSDMEIVSLQDS